MSDKNRYHPPEAATVFQVEDPVQLSVIITTFNGRSLLSRTLPTLFGQTCSPRVYEVILVVDGSTDGTAEMVSQYHPSCEFQILKQPHRGKAAARNRGLLFARGNLILFLDDDLQCDATLITEHIEAHQREGDLVVFGPMDVSPESPPSVVMQRAHIDEIQRVKRFLRNSSHWPTNLPTGPNCSLKRETILSLGGFDEEMPAGMEEQAFSYQLWEAGLRFSFHPPAATKRLYLTSTWELAYGDSRDKGRSEALLAMKYPHLRQYIDVADYRESGWIKIAAKRLAAHPSIPFETLARPLYWVADRISGWKSSQQIGIRIFSSLRSLVQLRCAVATFGGWTHFQQLFGVRVPALLYHNVGPMLKGTDPLVTISVRQFEKHIRWLKRMGFVGVSPEDWLAWSHEGKPLPDKPVMLTFDDAHADLAEYGLPILEKYGFKATIFAVTDRLGGTNTWSQMKYPTVLRCMTEQQIQEWSAKGFDFGSHTCTHPDLQSLREDDIVREMKGSEQQLLNLLGKRVTTFAYPFGSYSDNVVRHAESIYDLAFTVTARPIDLQATPHLLGRKNVVPKDTLLDLWLFVQFGWTRRLIANRWKRIRTHLFVPRRAHSAQTSGRL